ncbi:SIR2 family NAD-dependent protein deacylase [Corallococcus carmarthensis]|uniref:SIR2 family NAD-dependent protein deacylase n=1 Tax=Corallococcus carmarthensis TaxID=2316728 RepID=UPI00148E0FC5|nr:SIR2 family protein [Corallococcus carmarthensis]NOK16279.1 SIR2 family protein [Corallococcus carmarthensis]
MSIQRIAQAIQKKQCILFLGAGIHAPPPDGSGQSYPPAARPPLGGELSRRLAQASSYDTAYPGKDTSHLQRVAWHCEHSLGRNALVAAIRKEVDEGKTPSPLLKLLAELDFPLIVTTNYDNLLERALFAANKSPRVSIYKPDATQHTDDLDSDPDPSNPFLVKIHGDISRPESLVVTDEDYIHFVMRMRDKEQFNPIPETLQYHLRRWPVLFVGYSLLDYNLRLLFRTLRWSADKARIPDSFSIDKYPDTLVKSLYDDQLRLVRFVVDDLWAFIPALHGQVTSQMKGAA